MSKIKIESNLRPAIFTDLLGNRIVVPGFLQVPAGTRLDDLEWVEPGVKPIQQHTEWTVPSSKGGEYRVRNLNGRWSCECAGFKFRRTCKHIDKAQTGRATDRQPVKKGAAPL